MEMIFDSRAPCSFLDIPFCSEYIGNKKGFIHKREDLSDSSVLIPRQRSCEHAFFVEMLCRTSDSCSSLRGPPCVTVSKNQLRCLPSDYSVSKKKCSSCSTGFCPGFVAGAFQLPPSNNRNRCHTLSISIADVFSTQIE
jgi:hypothetical protein